MTDSDRDLTDQDRETIAGWRAQLEQLPHLYRYASVRGERFTWFYDLVLRSLLYFPPYRDLNDPFDGAVQLDYGGTPQEIRDFWEGRLMEDGKVLDAEAQAKIQGFVDGRDDPKVHRQMLDIHDEEGARLGVACFSEIADDLPMWAYYADAHRGVCLRFRTEPLWKPEWEGYAPAPITYEEDYPEVAFYRGSRFRRSQVVTLTKAKVWCHEREWRIVRRAGPGPTQFDHTALDGIIMGCRMSAVDEVRIRDVVARRTPQVELLKARPAERAFKLNIGPA